MTDNDSNGTEQWCREAIEQNKDDWKDFKNGDDEALNFLVGQVMEVSNGQANPPEVNEVFRSLRTEDDE